MNKSTIIINLAASGTKETTPLTPGIVASVYRYSKSREGIFWDDGQPEPQEPEEK